MNSQAETIGMAVSDTYAAIGLSIESLLLHAKALAPISATTLAELSDIQALTVDETWTEDDVRANVIDPIIRLLGYKKGEVFSVDRQRKLDFLDTRRFIDYAAALWQENFWLIEAKRPKTNRQRFDQKTLDQALIYATHPQVNAALIVLSDGNIFEVFDREASVAKPILRVARSQLTVDFDKLRTLLEPWQTWFFQKRRIVRMIDKVFNHEFNLNRVDEFRGLIDRRLNSKRLKFLENYRSNISVTNDADSRRLHLQTAGIVELVDIHLFQPQSWPELNIIAQTLIAQSRPGGFELLFKLLPDNPRDTNDIFWAQTLYVLMTMEGQGFAPNWLPSFVGGVPVESRSLTVAIEHLIALCLSYFEADEGRKIVLLFAAAVRRVSKVLSLVDPALIQSARARHAIHRFIGEELSFSQFISSPEGHLLQQLDSFVMDATTRFVAACADEQGSIRPVMAKFEVQHLWEYELSLVEAIPNYHGLLIERGLSEVGRMTEASCVSWDGLAHNALCFIARFERWRGHVVERHGPILSEFAAMGYWSARDFLNMPYDASAKPCTDKWAASRFFFNDEETARRLRKAYQSVS